MTKGSSKPTSQSRRRDAYSRFLDLPPGTRPPNYYQLLQLELFCTHPERIRHSARKQFRRIKPFEDHPDRDTREAVQDIMTRIANARVVLSDPDKKLAYDRGLAVEMDIDLDAFLRSKLAEPVPDTLVRIVAGGALVGDRIELLESKPTTIGSDPHCIITLPSARVARLHCQIEHRDGDWWITPIARDKPTLVNDHRCEEFMLDDGDGIEVGGFRLRFLRLPERKSKEALPPPLSLMVRRGPSVSSPMLNVLPGESIVIGHCETALWQLAGPHVSRHHCRIQPAGQDWELQDLRSTNGTQVNGKGVEKHTLRDRDEITIGQFIILASLRH